MVVSAICAAVAGFALIGMALLPRPFTLVDHLSILLGSQRLSGDRLVAYRSYVSNNLSIDSLYLLVHSLMWVGIAHVVSRRNAQLGVLVVAFGLIGAGLDFLESEWRWAAMTTLFAGNLPEPSHVTD